MSSPLQPVLNISAADLFECLMSPPFLLSWLPPEADAHCPSRKRKGEPKEEGKSCGLSLFVSFHKDVGRSPDILDPSRYLEAEGSRPLAARKQHSTWVP